MLQQFSWGAFLVASIVLNVVWYVFVGLVFYRPEVSAFLGGVFGGSSVDGVSVDDRDSFKDEEWRDGEIEREVDAALMGVSRMPDGVEVKSSSQVSFSTAMGEERYDQIGLVADVVQELKSIFSELEKKAGDKRDFFRLLARVKEDYGPLSGHPSVGALTGFIVEQAPFHLTAEELENLWY
ncbi:hypothetical protein QWY86_15680 [Pedobacter aquatilis]|uniref:hypothetical protein n=1 Tax=Pedobacter aquatilis TaxID=351343 RepID=UPI0025B3F836|nr:hypothetical protein [Pedobacter aquatilis]MDN3588124.1 hypothetical protein [Pedobacter aquatilis]